MSLSGAFRFTTDDFGTTICTFEMRLPSGAIQQSTTDLMGALNILGLAFPANAAAIQTFAAQQVSATAASTPSSSGSGSTAVNVGVNLGVKL